MDNVRSMDTRFWGPSGWRLLHTIAFVAPDLPCKDSELHTFFRNLPFVLPCKFCRASLTDYYAADPIPSHRGDFAAWLYRVHNRVNAKLREQGLIEGSDPDWKTVQAQYKAFIAAPCTQGQMVGWDFLFSVAYTTPCPAVASSPMPGAPPLAALTTPELRNRWGLISRMERLPYIQRWWSVLPRVLPFETWRAAWKSAVPVAPDIISGRRAITSWLYKAEQTVCRTLKADAPHDSFTGLCSELNTFSSGCGGRSKRIKTCRAVKSHARKTLKHRRKGKYKATGGFL